MRESGSGNSLSWGMRVWICDVSEPAKDQDQKAEPLQWDKLEHCDTDHLKKSFQLLLSLKRLKRRRFNADWHCFRAGQVSQSFTKLFMIRNRSAAHHIRIPSSAVRWRVMAMLWSWIFVTKLSSAIISYRRKWVIYTRPMRPKHQISRANIISIPGSLMDFDGVCRIQLEVERLFQIPDLQLRTPNQRRPASIQRWKENQRSKTSATDLLTCSHPGGFGFLDRFEC